MAINDNVGTILGLGDTTVARTYLATLTGASGATLNTQLANIIRLGATTAGFEYLDSLVAESGSFRTSVRTESVWATIRKTALAARYNNPHARPVMTSPPTITTGASQPGGLTREISYYTGTNSRYYSTRGGPLYNYASYLRFPVVTLGAISEGGNIGTNISGTNSRVAFKINSTKFAIRVLQNNGYRLIVDGQFVDMTGTNIGSNGYITYDFTSVGGRATRDIIVDMQVGQGFYGIAMATTDTIFQIDETTDLRAIAVGDSYTQGAVATHVGDNYFRTMCDYLGIDDGWSSGSGGTGYLANNPSTPIRYRIGERFRYDVYPNNPDLVCLVSGINDVSFGATIYDTVVANLKDLRSNLPNVAIAVFGCLANSTGPSAASLLTESTIKAAVDYIRDPQTVFIPVSNPTDGDPWLYGTGGISAPAGNGNCDVLLDAPGGHPTSAGHIALGMRAADAFLDATRSMI